MMSKTNGRQEDFDRVFLLRRGCHKSLCCYFFYIISASNCRSAFDRISLVTALHLTNNLSIVVLNSFLFLDRSALPKSEVLILS